MELSTTAAIQSLVFVALVAATYGYAVLIRRRSERIPTERRLRELQGLLASLTDRR